MTSRRQLLALLAAVLATRSLGIAAQTPGRIARIGFVRFGGRQSADDFLAVFRQAMGELGYFEGRNLALEVRYGEGRAERLPAFMEELVRLKVDVIVAADTPSTAAAKAATGTIPIVMANVVNPVGSGFVKSLARPGGNITGLSNMAGELGPKQLELLAESVPKLSRVSVLVNPANSGHASVLKGVQAAGAKTGIAVQAVEAATPQQIETAFAEMARNRTGAVIIAIDGFFRQQLRQIAQLALRYRMPSMSSSLMYAEAGCLMFYGYDSAKNYRRAAAYVDKILNGARPADLPVEQPTTIELAINRKTARTLGLTLPRELLVRADRVIE